MSTSVATTPMRPSILERLPPEIRNIVYSLCIVTSTIIVRSPLTAITRKRKKQQRSTFWNLLSVNKSIRDEASSWFYRSSTFVFGNDSWGSTKQPNEQAMRAFVTRVPKTQLALIRNIEFTIYGRPCYHARSHIFGNKKDVVNLNAMTTTILKHLKTLESVKFSYGREGPYYNPAYYGPYLDCEEASDALKAVMERLLAHETFRRMEIFKDTMIPMHRAAEMMIAENPGLSNVIVIPDGPIQNRSWG